MPALSPQAQNWTHRKAHANTVRAFDSRRRELERQGVIWWEDRGYLRLSQLATTLLIHIDYTHGEDPRWFPYWRGVAG